MKDAAERFEGSKPKKLPIAAIVVDQTCQMRAQQINNDHAEDLAADLAAGAKLPKPWVMEVEGHGSILVSGFHTFAAHVLNGETEIAVLARPGSYGEALITAAGSNNDPFHKALKPTRVDLQRAVRMALKGNSMLTVRTRLSDRKIAEQIGVSHTLVSKMRNEIEAREKGEPSPKKKAAAKQKAEPAAEEATEPAEVAEVVTSLQSDDWQGWPLEEVLADQPDYVNAAVTASGILTVGRMLDELDAGLTLGLNKAPLRKLHDFLAEIRTGKVPPVQTPHDSKARFDWGPRLAVVGNLTRVVLQVVNHHNQYAPKGTPDERESEEYKAIDAALAVIEKQFYAWRNRLLKRS